MRRPILQLAAICSLAFTLNTSAAVLYVDLNSTNPVSPYTDWSTAATNIQDAVDASTNGDLILVTNGIYQTGGSVSDNQTNRINVTAPMTVQSVNGPAVTIIEGYHIISPAAVRCAFLTNGATLSGFTLTNGLGLIGGGGVFCGSPNCVVSNCVIIGNTVFGGAQGGGAHSGILVDCKLIGNSAGGGGGAYGASLINCIVSSNSASYGGGMYNGTATNCLIVSNTAASFGGGSYQGTFVNCTLAENTAVSAGGGVYGGTGAWLYNSIVFFNSAPTGPNLLGATCDYCCTTPAVAGDDNITNDPAFVDITTGDFHLQPNSPCINAGNNSFITTSTDLDGNPRIVNGTVDMGAYESPYNLGVHYVSLTSTNPVSPFNGWTIAATNIQDAIDAASAGDSIIVSNGIYQIGGRTVNGYVLTNRVVINKAVTVQSINGPASTVIAGLPGTGGYPSSGYRCVYLTNGAALIGFTLTNGATSNSGTNTVTELSGAAVWCESTSAVISNCVLTHSYASHYGGAAYQGTLNNCVISNNTASLDGGGTYLANVDNSIIVSNGVVAKGFGGGGTAYGVSSNCLITGNSAPDGGGAYYSTLAECQISRNGASVGGGLYACVANNSLIFGNTARGDGGGAYNCSATNCTIVLNTATTLGEGGGVYGGSLMNCVVYDNIAFGSFNFYFPSNVLMNYCCTTPLPTNGIGNITNEPIFVNFNGSDFHLQSNSPCINAGNNAYVTSTTDLDGNPRIVGGTVDIGAYEYQTPTSIISYAWLQQYGLPTDGSADFADYDGTGMNVYQDWIAGLNPTNVLSVLAMLPPAPTNNPAGLVVSWESVSNRTYFLQSSTNLGAQPMFSTIQSNIVGQTGTTSYNDTNAVGNGPFFYRVGVQQ